MSQTLGGALAWWATSTSDAVAIVVEGDRATYRVLHDWADRVAVRLLELGVRRGDRVAILAPNSMEYCALIFGIIRAGAIVRPISTRLTSPEIRESLDDTTPVLVFADEPRRAKLRDLGVDGLGLDEITALREGPRQSPGVELDPDAPVVIISTSGSTAKPKGVMLTHRSMIAGLTEYALEDAWCRAGERVLSVSSMSTSAGFIKLIQYVSLGAVYYIEPVFDAQATLRLLEREKIAVFGGAPVFYEQMAACEDFAKADLSNLKFAVVGGARVSSRMLAAWLEKGVVIRQIYGQTESGGTSAIAPAHLAPERPEICGSGRIFTQIRVIDDHGQPCAAGTPGEIIVKGPSLMVGYWNNPEGTAEALRDGWLYTGDIGVIGEDSQLIFVDRKKDIIISGGLNISAAEVERAIADFQGVEEVLVIAAEDQKFGETPMAVIYASQTLSIPDLISHCNARLANYKVPRYVALENEPMPRLATGKLSKPAMRLKYKNAAATLPRVR